MPSYFVTSPQGQRFKVTAPEGATQEQILAYAQSSVPQSPSIGAQFQNDLLGTAKSLANQGVRDVASFATSNRPDAGTSLGRIGQALYHPFKPIVGAMTLSTAPVGAVLHAGVGAPVERATGSQWAGLGADLLAGLVAPAALNKAFSGVKNAYIGSKAQALAKDSSSGIPVLPRKTAQEKEFQFLQDLVSPDMNKAEKIERVSRSIEGGKLNQSYATPNHREIDMINTISKVGVSPKKTMQANYNTIQKANDAEIALLQKKLTTTRIKYKTHIADIISDANAKILDNPNLIENASDGSQIIMNAPARGVINKTNALLKSNPPTPAGVLKARQQLDAWARQRKTGVFEKDSLLGDALREVRTSMNNYLELTVKDAAVKDSLRKQANMFSVMDNMAPKIAKGGKNRITRAAGELRKAGPYVPYAAGLAGATGLGAYIAGGD